MNKYQQPTKAALKRKYGITNDDFQILTQSAAPTSAEWEKEGHLLERVADWFGVPTYVVRTGMTVAAVLLIPASVATFHEDINKSLKFYSEMAQPFQKLPAPKRELSDMYFSHSNIANTTTSVVTYTITPPSGGV